VFSNNNLRLAVAVFAAAFFLHFARQAFGLDINLDGIGSVSTGGVSKLDKAIGVIDIIKSYWFKIADGIAILALSIAGWQIRRRAPDTFERYSMALLSVFLMLGSGMIVSIILQLVDKAK